MECDWPSVELSAACAAGLHRLSRSLRSPAWQIALAALASLDALKLHEKFRLLAKTPKNLSIEIRPLRSNNGLVLVGIKKAGT